MSFQEEPESRIDLTMQRDSERKDSPPLFDVDYHARANYEAYHPHSGNDHGSDDTVSDENTAQISIPLFQPGDLESQVGETQFVPIERDTQPSTDFDMSPTTRKVLENTESNSAMLPPPVMSMTLLERLDNPAVSDGPEFRFGKPPNAQNMNLRRPPPGPHRAGRLETSEASSTEKLTFSKGNLPLVDAGVVRPGTEPITNLKIIQNVPSTAIKCLLSHGNPSQDDLSVGGNPDSALPDTQIESSHSSGEVTDQTNQVAEAGGLQLHSQAKLIVSSSRNRTGESLKRNKVQPFEGAELPMNASLKPELLAMIKPNNNHADYDPRSPNQQTRHTKSRSPPFLEAALTDDIRAGSAGCPTAETASATSAHQNTDGGAANSPEIRNLKPKRKASGILAESVGTVAVQEGLIPINSAAHPEDEIQILPDVTVREMPDQGDRLQSEAFDKGSQEARNIPRDLPRNHRPRSRNKTNGGTISKHGTYRLPSDGPANRPLPDPQLGPQDLRHNSVLHNTRDSGVSKKIISRASSPHHIQTSCRIPRGGNEEVNAASLLHMATVMLTVEKEQLDNAVAEAQLQSAQIKGLAEENAELHERIKHLSKDNQTLLAKSAGFRKSYELCKAKMNDVMKIQRELKIDAKNLDRRHFEVLKAAGREMDAKVLEAKSQVCKDSQAILKEARLEINRQNQRIDLLNSDINHQLLDLQRERGLRENLQKQLENREKQQEELKSVLSDHQRSTVAMLSCQEDLLKEVLNASAESTLRLTDCQALIKNLDESEPKPIPSLIKLSELIFALSIRVEQKLQAAEDGSVQVRDAGIEVLAELKHRLDMLSEDQIAQQKLNAVVAGLREENAKLEEKIRSREKETLEIRKFLSEVQQELQQCQAQFSVTKEDLGRAIAASREDTLLRTQLQDLQTSYSIVKQQAESSAMEAERAQADLQEQENSMLLAQQEKSKLQDTLQQSQAMVTSFDDQKKAYVRQMKDESNILRIQMERDFQARLAEDEARHDGIVSGLRRQITEANDKLTQAQKKLCDAEKMKSSREEEIHTLSKQLSAAVTEIGSLQDKASSMEYAQDKTDGDLRIAQEQLMQYLEKVTDWSALVEGNALEFAKRRNEIDDILTKSKIAGETEIKQLRQLVSTLQKKIEDSDTVISKAACYLRSRGVLRPDLAFSDWAAGLSCNDSQPETNVSPPRQLATSEHHEVSAVSQESFNDSFRDSVRGSTEPVCNEQAGTHAKFGGERTPHVANPPNVSFNEDWRKRLTEIDHLPLTSFSESSSRRSDQDNHQLEHDPGIRPLESPNKFSTFNNALKSFPTTIPTLHVHSSVSKQPGMLDVRFSSNRKLERTERIVIPDSQEEIIQNAIPSFARPSRRVGERQNALTKDNRTVSRTEITEYCVRTSETYVGTRTEQESDAVHLPQENQPNDLSAVDSEEESSGLSEPPENLDKLDFVEFMDSGEAVDHKNPAVLQLSDNIASTESITSHSVISPRPNSSRMRTRPLLPSKEARQPKSILKRTNSMIQTSDTTANARLGERSLGHSQLDLPGIHRGASVNKRISKTISGSIGRDTAARRSPYNHPVAGSKDLHKSSHFPVQNMPAQEQRPSTADVFTISSSPAMGQPQRNSKKRALSGIGMRDNNRPSKLHRPSRPFIR